jgi:hypothetical protein
MYLYRIYTEATGEMRERALEQVIVAFPGFTVHDTVGYWRGKREASMVIEVVAQVTDRRKVYDLAQAIREVNAHQAVLVTYQRCGVFLA